MHRFFAQRTGKNEAALLPEEETHALKVLRLQPGDACQALIDGRIFAARIGETSPRVLLTLTGELPSAEPSVRITLYQGVPKSDKMDFIVQKCTEIGVHCVVPVHFSRCVAQWTGKDTEKKLIRFRRIAAEAAKQCGRALIPEIAPPVAFSALPGLLSAHEIVFVPWEEAQGRGVRSFLRGQRDLAVVIGPEGGISPEEIDALTARGALPVTLGKRILRTETAGLAALASILTLTGDMGL